MNKNVWDNLSEKFKWKKKRREKKRKARPGLFW